MQQISSKCKFCDFKTNGDIDRYAKHIEMKHADMMIPDMDGYQFIYYLMTGKTHGSCIVCKKDTTWNPVTMKYNRYCDNPLCKEKYREMFKNRMINTHGKVSLLDDPDMQKKMLAHRRISGVYRWPDGTSTTYTGSYEKAFLQLLAALEWDPSDIMAPSPHTYEYIFQGKSHFYIPDFYIPSLNCEIEIKDGGDNPNMHHKIQEVDKVKEALKDMTMRQNNDVDYVKIVNKNSKTFLDYLMRSKERTFSGKKYSINICDDVIKTLPKDAIIRNESGYYIYPDNSIKIFSESSDDIVISKNIAREFNGHKYYPMYILLSATSTPINKGVRKFLNEPYGHASISFDNSMNNLYTFGYKKIGRSFGMTGESIEKIAMKTTYEPTASYGLYVIFLNEEQIKLATDMVKSIYDRGDNYKYSVKGLVNIALKNPTFDTDQFFCSWFVAHILSCARHDVITKHPSLYTPYDLSKIRGVYFVDGGLIKDYNRWKVESITAKILNKLIKDKNTMALESFNDLPLFETNDYIYE